MASYEQVLKFENEKPQGVLRLVEAKTGWTVAIRESFGGRPAILPECVGLVNLSFHKWRQEMKYLMALTALISGQVFAANVTEIAVDTTLVDGLEVTGSVMLN